MPRPALSPRSAPGWRSEDAPRRVPRPTERQIRADGGVSTRLRSVSRERAGIAAGHREEVSAMRLTVVVLVLVVVWAVSAFLSGRIAARKGRGVRRWVILGVVLGPLALLVHACYPARFRPETVACPKCGKPLGVRAVACQYCQYRFPSVDVMITRAPTDADSRRGLLSEMAREYGIPYADATRLLEQLPVAGYRHVLPDQVSEYVRRLEAVGATVTVVPTTAGVPGDHGPGSRPVIQAGEKPSGSRPR
jgi:hypothetical protein